MPPQDQHHLPGDPGLSTGESVAAGALLVVVSGGVVLGAQQSGSTGAILAFAGTIIVALITAVTTSHRQQRQLRHNTENLSRQLSEEKERLAAQLESDRQLRIRDEVRALLDDAAEILESILATTREINPKASDSTEAIRTMSRTFSAVRARLALRFPTESPVRLWYGKATEHALEVLQARVQDATAGDPRGTSTAAPTNDLIAAQAAFEFGAYVEMQGERDPVRTALLTRQFYAKYPKTDAAPAPAEAEAAGGEHDAD